MKPYDSTSTTRRTKCCCTVCVCVVCVCCVCVLCVCVCCVVCVCVCCVVCVCVVCVCVCVLTHCKNLFMTYPSHSNLTPSHPQCLKALLQPLASCAKERTVSCSLTLHPHTSTPSHTHPHTPHTVRIYHRRGARRWKKIRRINGHAFVAKRFQVCGLL